MVNARPGPLYPRDRTGTHFIGVWVDPRADLDRCGKSGSTGIRSPDRPASSESLYRLSYRGPRLLLLNYFIWVDAAVLKIPVSISLRLAQSV